MKARGTKILNFDAFLLYLIRHLVIFRQNLVTFVLSFAKCNEIKIEINISSNELKLKSRHRE